MDVKTVAILSLAAVAAASGVATQYPDPFNPSEAIEALLVILFAMATFAWFRADAIQRSYHRSPILNVAVFGLAAVALPYYFIRSRGWKHGAVAVLGAVRVFVVVCVISALTAMATAWTQTAWL